MSLFAACGRIARPQANPIASADLHHVAGGLTAERLRHQSKPEGAGESGAERLMLLLELLDLLGNDLDELLELLELRGHELKQLLQKHQLLLLKELHLLELLRHDLEQLCDLLLWRYCADAVRRDAVAGTDPRTRQLASKRLTCVRGEAPRVLGSGIDRW